MEIKAACSLRGSRLISREMRSFSSIHSRTKNKSVGCTKAFLSLRIMMESKLVKVED